MKIKPFLYLPIILSAIFSGPSIQQSRLRDSMAEDFQAVKERLKSFRGSSPLEKSEALSWGDLMKLYYPDDALPYSTGLGDWAGCMDYANFPVASENGELKPECRPDTLYTWQSEQLRTFSQVISGNSLRKSLFAHINPVATFAYGEVQIRIKLKKEAKFVFLRLRHSPPGDDYCVLLKPEQMDNSVIVRYANVGSAQEPDYRYDGSALIEYILCSDGPIHSWSMGTKQGYDEIVNAVQWYNQHRPFKTNEWIAYMPWKLFGSDVDGQDWSQKHLRRNLTRWREMIRQGLGGIHYAPGVPPDAAVHFSTSRKAYWTSKSAVKN